MNRPIVRVRFGSRVMTRAYHNARARARYCRAGAIEKPSTGQGGGGGNTSESSANQTRLRFTASFITALGTRFASTTERRGSCEMSREKSALFPSSRETPRCVRLRKFSGVSAPTRQGDFQASERHNDTADAGVVVVVVALPATLLS